jgi:hypothetical protein
MPDDAEQAERSIAVAVTDPDTFRALHDARTRLVERTEGARTLGDVAQTTGQFDIVTTLAYEMGVPAADARHIMEQDAFPGPGPEEL